VGYVLSAPYTVKFTVDVFNVLNLQEVQYVDQRYTLDFVQPMQAAQCANKDSISQANPITAIQNDCPDIKYLKTIDGRAATVNGTFGRPQAGPTGSHGFPAQAYQLPIRFRFGLTLAF
jgi:hypothetical protein